MDNRPIGIFDSGVGGLSILLHVKKLLTRETFIYLADQANVPYGAKSEKQLKNICERVVKFLLKHDVKLIIVACNAATVHTIEYLRSKFDTPIIGTVPVIKTAAEKTKNKKIGILSTVATAKSPYQKELIKKFAKGIKVTNMGARDLVNYVERGEVDSEELKRELEKIAKKFPNIDILALGCTHYPFLKSAISESLGGHVDIIDSGSAIAKQTRRVLAAEDLLASTRSTDLFFTTGTPEKFLTTVQKLGIKLARAGRAEI